MRVKIPPPKHHKNPGASYSGRGKDKRNDASHHQWVGEVMDVQGAQGYATRRADGLTLTRCAEDDAVNVA